MEKERLNDKLDELYAMPLSEYDLSSCIKPLSRLYIVCHDWAQRKSKRTSPISITNGARNMSS